MQYRSDAQNERQHGRFRNKGRYAEVNPCYYCGKSAGINYYSLEPFVGMGGYDDRGLVLCKKCVTFLYSLPVAKAGRLLKLSNYGSNPQKRTVTS